MTTEQKKKWVVCSFYGSSDLETKLNEFHADGYSIWDVDPQKERIIACLREEPPGKTILEALMGSKVKKVDLESDANTYDDVNEDLEEFAPRAAITRQLANETMSLIRARYQGDPRVNEHVKNLVEHVAKRSSAHDISEAITDYSRLLKAHKDRTAQQSADKLPCDDSCSVNAVLLMLIEQLKLYQSAHPLS